MSIQIFGSIRRAKRTVIAKYKKKIYIYKMRNGPKRYNLRMDQIIINVKKKIIKEDQNQIIVWHEAYANWSLA